MALTQRTRRLRPRSVTSDNGRTPSLYRLVVLVSQIVAMYYSPAMRPSESGGAIAIPAPLYLLGPGSVRSDGAHASSDLVLLSSRAFNRAA